MKLIPTISLAIFLFVCHLKLYSDGAVDIHTTKVANINSEKGKPIKEH